MPGETSPWFSVPLQPDGACFSALLPKPRPTITGFQYFVEALDRSFAVVLRPEDALDRPYAPRVVGSEADCERGRLVAAGVPSGSVVVSLARDAAGRVLESLVAQGGGSASLARGFSLDGVSLAGSGPASAGSSSSSGGGGGSGMKLVAIGGGVLAAGAAVAVAGGGGGGGDAGSGSGGGSGAAPGGGTAPGGGGAGGSSLTGRWTGLAGSGDGIRLTLSEQGVTCRYAWDFILDLSQSGSGVNGTFSAPFRTLSCSIPLPIPELNEGGETGPLSGSVSGAAVTLQLGPMTFVGNASGSVIEGTARHPEAPVLNYTWRVRR